MRVQSHPLPPESVKKDDKDSGYKQKYRLFNTPEFILNFQLNPKPSILDITGLEALKA